MNIITFWTGAISNGAYHTSFKGDHTAVKAEAHEVRYRGSFSSKNKQTNKLSSLNASWNVDVPDHIHCMQTLGKSPKGIWILFFIGPPVSAQHVVQLQARGCHPVE